MITAHELEQVRRRVDRLEAELDDTRRQLALLERRLETEPAKVPVEEAKVATPPPLPSALLRRLEPTPALTALPSSPPPAVPREPKLPKRAPVVVPPAPRAAVSPEAPTAPLRVWLERLQLWPPSEGEEGSAEARLGAWWATRVGALLAVVGVVFFGIYVSRHTPAWVKFAELLAVAAGVSALGRWIARRLPAFGEVVFAAGLALFFFASYAGHAVPAVRVFPELWMSVLAQAVAVAGIVATALWRRSAMIATLAVGLGYVTAIVSERGGLESYALGAGALLAGVAVALRRGRGWEGPSVVAMPGAYAVFALGLFRADIAGAERLGAATWPYLVGVAALFFVRDWRREPVAPEAVPAEEKWFQNANSSLALLCGFAAALGWWRAGLEWFYGGATVLLATAAWLRARQAGRRDAVSAVLTAKATGALTLAVIEIAGARDAAVALLVQAWVLAWTARRLDSRVLAAGAGLVAVVATLWFAARGPAAAPIWSLDAGRAVAFTLGLALLATQGGRWLVPQRAARRVAETAAATVASGGLLVAVSRWTPAGLEPALVLGLAGLFAAAAWSRRSEACGWAALALATAAQLWLWGAASGTDATGTLRWNALIVIGVTTLAGALTPARAAAGAAWAMAVVGAVLTSFALWPGERAMFSAAAGALVLGVLAAVAKGRHLAWIATLALGLGAACWAGRGADAGAAWIGAAALAAWALPAWLRVNARADSERRAEPLSEAMERVQALVATVLGLRALMEWLDGGALGLGIAVAALAVFGLALRPGVRSALGASWMFWGAALLVAGCGGVAGWVAAAVLAWVPALVWVRAPERWKIEFTGWRRHAAGVQVALAAPLGVGVAMEAFDAWARTSALIGVVVVAALVARPGRVGAARWAALASAIWLGCVALGEIAHGAAQGAGLAAVLTAAAALAALPLWLGGGGATEARRLGRYAGGGAALAVAFAAFAAQRGELAPYTTVGWGLAAIVVFMAGLFRRVAPYRVLGLLGLAACVSRVFLVDLNSTLHRIVAFIVLGVVLLWVGFSYHRFKHLVSDPESHPDSFTKK